MEVIRWEDIGMLLVRDSSKSLILLRFEDRSLKP